MIGIGGTLSLVVLVLVLLVLSGLQLLESFLLWKQCLHGKNLSLT
jgi:hypothetical protein